MSSSSSHKTSATKVNLSDNRVKSIVNIFRYLEGGVNSVILEGIILESDIARQYQDKVLGHKLYGYHQALLIITDSGYYISEFMNDGKVHSYEIEVEEEIKSDKQGIQISERNNIWWEIPFIFPGHRQNPRKSIIFNHDVHFTVDEIGNIMNQVAIKDNYRADSWNCQVVARSATNIIEKLAQNQSYSNKNEIPSNPELVFMAQIGRKWKNQVEIGPNQQYALLFAQISFSSLKYIIVEFQNNSVVLAYWTKIKDEPKFFMEWDQFQDDESTWQVIKYCYLLESVTSLKMIKDYIMNCGVYNIIDNNCQIVTEKTYEQFKQNLPIPNQIYRNYSQLQKINPTNNFKNTEVIQQIYIIQRQWAIESKYSHSAILIIAELNSTIIYYIVEYLYNNQVYCYEIKVKEKIQNHENIRHFQERSYAWNVVNKIRIDYQFLNIKTKHIFEIMSKIASNQKFFHLIKNNSANVTGETEKYLYCLKDNYYQNQITKSTNPIINQDILQQRVYTIVKGKKHWNQLLKQKIYYLILNSRFVIEYKPNGSIILEDRSINTLKYILSASINFCSNLNVPPNTTISQIIQLMKKIASEQSFSLFENNTKKLLSEMSIALTKLQSKPKNFFEKYIQFDFIDQKQYF